MIRLLGRSDLGRDLVEGGLFFRLFKFGDFGGEVYFVFLFFFFNLNLFFMGGFWIFIGILDRGCMMLKERKF